MTKIARQAKVQNGTVKLGGQVLTKMGTEANQWRTATVAKILRNGAETRLFFTDGSMDMSYAVRLPA